MTGASGLTVTVNDLVSLRIGLPSSETRTCTVLVELPSAAGTLQLNRPLPLLMLAPAGGLRRLKDNVLVGKSASVAVAVKLMVCPALTVWSAIRAPSTGAVFTSLTVKVKLLVTLKDLAFTAGGLVSVT